MLDEKQKFNKLVEDRLELNPDSRQGLREAILSNQTLKALVYIELLFDELDKKDAPVAATKEEEVVPEVKKTPTTQKSTSTRSKKTEDKTEKNDEDNES